MPIPRVDSMECHRELFNFANQRAIFLGDVCVSDTRLILIPSVWNLRVSMAAGLYALLGICVLRFAVDERIRKRLVLCCDYTECPKKGVPQCLHSVLGGISFLR